MPPVGFGTSQLTLAVRLWCVGAALTHPAKLMLENEYSGRPHEGTALMDLEDSSTTRPGGRKALGLAGLQVADGVRNREPRGCPRLHPVGDLQTDQRV